MPGAKTSLKRSCPPLGLHQGELRLSPYRDEWPVLFESEKTIIRSAVGEQISDIQHVGSTAIVGMPSKPILDKTYQAAKSAFIGEAVQKAHATRS